MAEGFNTKAEFQALAELIKADTTMPAVQKYQMLLEILRTIAHLEEREIYAKNSVTV